MYDGQGSFVVKTLEEVRRSYAQVFLFLHWSISLCLPISTAFPAWVIVQDLLLKTCFRKVLSQWENHLKISKGLRAFGRCLKEKFYLHCSVDLADIDLIALETLRLRSQL